MQTAYNLSVRGLCGGQLFIRRPAGGYARGLGAFYVVLLIIHMVASAIWLGGGLFTELILGPALRNHDKMHQALSLSTASARSFVRMVWVSIVALAVTGVAMLILGGWASTGFLFGSYPGALMLSSGITTAAAVSNGLIITLLLMPRRSSWIQTALRINLLLATTTVILMVAFSASVGAV